MCMVAMKSSIYTQCFLFFFGLFVKILEISMYRVYHCLVLGLILRRAASFSSDFVIVNEK